MDRGGFERRALFSAGVLFPGVDRSRRAQEFSDRLRQQLAGGRPREESAHVRAWLGGFYAWEYVRRTLPGGRREERPHGAHWNRSDDEAGQMVHRHYQGEYTRVFPD